MSSIAMMVSRNSLDAPLAGTFGKAKWLLLWDAGEQPEFRRNETLSGGSVAGAIAASGCQDVVAAHVGEKACAHLTALGIRLWKGPADTPVRDVIEMHLRSELPRWGAEQLGGSGGCTSTARGQGAHAHHDHVGAATPTVVQLRRRGPRD